MLSAALGLTLTAFQPAEVTDSRCLDTWVDRTHPDANFGRDFALVVGPGAATLIKFPLIDQAVPAGFHVKEARLELRVLDKSLPKLTVNELSQNWGEGNGIGADSTTPGKLAAKGCATWKAAQRGMAGWETSLDSPRAPIKGATASHSGDLVTVTGLADLVTAWIQDPSRNRGLLLTAGENTAFGSTEANLGPKLVVTLEANSQPLPDLAIVSGTPTTDGWSVTVANIGKVPAGAVDVSWTGPTAGNRTLPQLQPGQSSQVEFSGSGPVDVQVDAKSDADPSNNFLRLSPSQTVVRLGEQATELAGWQRTARMMNEWALPHSRSHGFTDGSPVRIRVEPGKAGLPPESERPRALLAAMAGLSDQITNPQFVRTGLGWATDTRDDSNWFPGLPLPALGASSSSPYPLPDPMLFGSADLAVLASLGQGLPETPGSLLLRVKDLAGDPVAEPELHVATPDGKVLGVVRGNSSGSVPLVSSQGMLPDAKHPWLDYKLQKSGETVVERLSVWDMWRERTRTGAGVATIEVRVPLPSMPVDRTNDLALKRIVKDEANRKPGALDALVDDDPETALALDADDGKSWVEVDLGRDKPIVEVQLVFRGQVPNTWKLSTSETGAEDQVTWTKEESGRSQAAKWGTVAGDLTTVKVKARIRRARSVRLTLGAHEKASLAALKVYTFASS